MNIDTSFLQNSCTVIWCKTKEEAQDLYENVILCDPSMDARLKPKVLRFDREKEADGLGFRFERYDNRIDVGYGSMSYYRRKPYNIIEFSSLIANLDFGQINNGYSNVDAAIAALF